MKPALLIVHAERYAGGPGLEAVRVRDGRITEVGPRLVPRPDEKLIDARGGALLPGLHDHHLHLFALAAARASVACGPPEVTTPDQLARALRAQPGSGWLRGVGYHESVAGLLDRAQLDAIVARRPVRIQHTSGKMWFVNSAGARALGLAEHRSLDGVECDTSGKPTGRLFRLDEWLRDRLGARPAPDLAAVSAELASYGVTGVTDTTPGNDDSVFDQFAAAMERGELRQRVRLMGSEDLTSRRRHDRLVAGELKIMLDEYALPELHGLAARIRRCHDAGRGVALHCITRTELVFALGALMEAGGSRDRIEHASVTPLDTVSLILRSGVTVVTQPGLIAERGDRYLADVAPPDIADLYRLGSLLAHGVPLAASSDAPYGHPDPWRAMRAAVNRRTRSGALIGAAERLSAETALASFLGAAAAPGGAARAVAPGAAADLCLLDTPWREARERLDAEQVVLTVRGGEVIYQR